MSVSDLPVNQIREKMASSRFVYVMEEVCNGSGIRETLALQMQPDHFVTGVDLGPGFIPHGTVNQLYEHYGLDAQSVCDSVLEVLGGEN